MRVVYTAESIALAVLEVLVYLDSSDVLTAYSLCSAEFNDSLVERYNFEYCYYLNELDIAYLSVGDYRMACLRFKTALDTRLGWGDLSKPAVEDFVRYLPRPALRRDGRGHSRARIRGATSQSP